MGGRRLSYSTARMLFVQSQLRTGEDGQNCKYSYSWQL